MKIRYSKTLHPSRRTIGWSLLSLLLAYLAWLPIHLATEAHCHAVVHNPDHGHSHHHPADAGHDQHHGHDEAPGHSHSSAEAHTLNALKSDSIDVDRVPAALALVDVTPTPGYGLPVAAKDTRPNWGGSPGGPASSRAPPRA